MKIERTLEFGAATGNAQRIRGTLPKLRTIDGGPWRVENPGLYGPGKVTLVFDTDTNTVRVEDGIEAVR